MMKDQSLKSSPPSGEAISHQLERMLASPDLNATPQQIALLKYVVNQTLAGNADRIKGYTVATEVFGRRSDFDQSIDPIVSIQASRLRQALARYYETTGKHDPLHIDIPKGTYVPTFVEQRSDDQYIAAEQAAPVGVMAAWPNVLVRPLANLSANPQDDYLSIGLTAELAHALGHYREIRVLEAGHRDQKLPPPETDFDFIINGNVRRDPAGVKVAIRLSDIKTGLQIWSGKYQGDLEAAEMISFQEEVAAEIAVRVAGGNAVIPRHLSGLSRNKPVPDLTTYEAMLRYWESATRLTGQSMVRAIKALKHAVAHEPDYGQTWSMLAAQYANNYGLEMVNLPTPLEKAVEYAQKGVSLDPTNRRARMILAYVRLMENKLPEARCEAETAYNLCPNSLMVLDTIGWVMALAGGWERGVNWIKKAIKLNPYYRPWIRHAVCFNWFRAGNYEKAYRETLHFTMPKLFWDPLLKAAACGHLGKIEEGQACVRALLALKPDFAQRGRILIGRYVKFEDIVDRIIEGLGILGMKIGA
jgi:adenylate cyclase